MGDAGGFNNVGLVQSVETAYVKVSSSRDAVDPAHFFVFMAKLPVCCELFAWDVSSTV